MKQTDRYQLNILDPGHFHAALLQKSMYDELDSTVLVFAPEGEEVEAYLDLVESYNNRQENPTAWKEELYLGKDFLEQMLEKAKPKQSIVVLAGNNKKKIDYIVQSVQGGLNVLADKPMAINGEGYEKLKTAFKEAEKKEVLLYDIMTERYAITNILQKTFLEMPEIFGELEKGTGDDPSVIFESVHHFYKEVSGKPLIRPDWYFDTEQQGDGIVDVTTHLIDLAMWECFEGKELNYEKDLDITSVKRWPTEISLEEFSKVTGKDQFPDFLQKDLKDKVLNVFANGEIRYELKGIHTRIAEEWRYEAPKGGGDTYYSEIKGSRATLLLLQDKERNFEPTLYIVPNEEDDADWNKSFEEGIQKLNDTYQGLAYEEDSTGYKILIPEEFATTHEGQFAEVAKKYLSFLDSGEMPTWERDFMLTKYYLTTESFELNKNKRIK